MSLIFSAPSQPELEATLLTDNNIDPNVEDDMLPLPKGMSLDKSVFQVWYSLILWQSEYCLVPIPRKLNNNLNTRHQKHKIWIHRKAGKFFVQFLNAAGAWIPNIGITNTLENWSFWRYWTFIGLDHWKLNKLAAILTTIGKLNAIFKQNRPLPFEFQTCLVFHHQCNHVGLFSSPHCNHVGLVNGLSRHD